MAFTFTKHFQIRLVFSCARFHRCVYYCKQSFKEHEICIKTCGSLYKRWHEEKRFRTLPNGDLHFKITYFDNGASDLKVKKPVIVVIHGAPGSYKDFIGLSTFFEHKARIIVPNFPDFTVSKPGVFRFSGEEKAQFIKDFLSAISILKIDSLITHSSGIYPGLHLCLDKDLPVKSIIMLNPGTFSYDMKAVKHIKVMKKIVAASEIAVFLKILKYFGPILLKVGKVPVRSDNFLDPLLSATTMVHSNIQEAKEMFLCLSQKKIPILYAFSKDDKLIGEKSSYQLANLLGISKEEIYTYDKDGILINEGKNSDLIKVMSFEKGSHYVLWKHPDIIHKAIEDFLQRNIVKV